MKLPRARTVASPFARLRAVLRIRCSTSFAVVGLLVIVTLAEVFLWCTFCVKVKP